MGLDSKRSSADRYIDALSKPFMRFSPNSLSGISTVFALLFGIFFYIGRIFLIFAIISLILSALLDAVDGKVARTRNLASRKGDLVDHFLDRVSDIFIISGIGLSAYAGSVYALLGLEGVLLTSYMGTQSQALGIGRDYSGLMGRADRLVAVLAFTLIQLILPFHYSLYNVLLTPSTILLLWFFVAGNITAVQRFSSAFRKL